MDPKEKTQNNEKSIVVLYYLPSTSVLVTLHITDDGNIDNAKLNKNNSHSMRWKCR